MHHINAPAPPGVNPQLVSTAITSKFITDNYSCTSKLIFQLIFFQSTYSKFTTSSKYSSASTIPIATSSITAESTKPISAYKCLKCLIANNVHQFFSET
jgi:hypothetical protein